MADRTICCPCNWLSCYRKAGLVICRDQICTISGACLSLQLDNLLKLTKLPLTGSREVFLEKAAKWEARLVRSRSGSIGVSGMSVANSGLYLRTGLYQGSVPNPEELLGLTLLYPEFVISVIHR